MNKSFKTKLRNKVRKLSKEKQEPRWMLELRLRALEEFFAKSLPEFGPSLRELDFEKIKYYYAPQKDKKENWEEIPENIRKIYEELGIPEAERRLFLGGVTAQWESEVIYKNLQERLKKQGVIFCDMDSAPRLYQGLVRKYFGKVVDYREHKFTALNTAFWSGGSFIYVPQGVRVELPLQAYFRINTRNMGQFERTLIIADKDSEVTYIEGCSAPVYTSFSLHSAVVEIIAEKGARVRYITVQNWANNIYNLVTKRMIVKERAHGIWIDGNLGSRVTMKYPSCYLVGKEAKGELISVAMAGDGQVQDTGGRMIHLAPYTQSKIISKSISQGKGVCTFRGLIRANQMARSSKAFVECDALLINKESVSNTYPLFDITPFDFILEHEASVTHLEDKLFYLAQRGIDEKEGHELITTGFVEPFTKELPLEYAVEMNRLLKLEMEGSVG